MGTLDKSRNRGYIVGMTKPLHIQKGDVFHRLTAIRPKGSHKSGRRMWEFRCQCGTKTTCMVYTVVNGHTRSCGCYKNDSLAEVGDPNLKRCTSCKAVKPLTEFAKSKGTRFGTAQHCKICRKVYYGRNREHIRLHANGRSPAMKMLARAKSRAKRDGLPFDLTIEDLTIPATCPLLGIPLIAGIGKHTGNSPSIDKIVPSLGYVRGNVWVISHRANAIKRDASLTELETLTKNWRLYRERKRLLP